jgi:hypothetical protein
VCGMLGITTAAVITGWVGGRFPIAMPFLLPILTCVLCFCYIGLGHEMGYELPALCGVNILILTMFAVFVGFGTMLLPGAIWVVRQFGSSADPWEDSA